jgi:hypothetical protein
MGMYFSLPNDDYNNHTTIDFIKENKELKIEIINLKSDKEALIQQVNSLKELILKEGEIINKMHIE